MANSHLCGQHPGDRHADSKYGGRDGNTKVTVSPELTEGNKYKYANADGLEQPAYDEDVSVLTDWDGEADIKMATGETIMIVECTQDNKARKAGTGEVTAAV